MASEPYFTGPACPEQIVYQDSRGSFYINPLFAYAPDQPSRSKTSCDPGWGLLVDFF
jgi:hypothetical protein